MLLSAAQRATFGVWISFLLAAPVPLRAGDLTPEDVIAKHLQSLGSAQVRAGLKSRVVEGASRTELVQLPMPAKSWPARQGSLRKDESPA